MFHPSRGGVRGGKDQFKWDNVKEDKFRENYLGHSVMAPVGRWQKGKDLTWYAKDQKKAAAGGAAVDEEQRRRELQLVKEEEEAAMAEMLGLAKPRRRSAAGPQGSLGKWEAEELLKKGKGSDFVQGERITGVGFGSSVSGQKLAAAVAAATDTLRGSEVTDARGEGLLNAGEKGSVAKEGTGKEGSGGRTEGDAGDEDGSSGHKKEEGGRKREHGSRQKGDDKSDESESSDGSDSGSEESSDREAGDAGREGKGGVGRTGAEESRSEKKSRKRREQRSEKRRRRREEELSGSKGVSEKRLKRRRRELRLERKKQRREEKKRAHEEKEKREVERGGHAEGRPDSGSRRSRGSFEDMMKAGQLIADRAGFVKERRAEWREVKRHGGEEHQGRDHWRD